MEILFICDINRKINKMQIGWMGIGFYYFLAKVINLKFILPLFIGKTIESS